MFWQTIKMAFKSLGSNKVRTFLTMLGVIIGVTTVALLTTVSQGATDAVIGALNKESRLVTFMPMGKTPEKQLKKDKFELAMQNVDSKIGQYIYSYYADGKANVNHADKTIYSSYYETYIPVSTTITGVSEKYKDVRRLELVGNYMSKADECVVDRVFIDTFYGKDFKSEDMVGKTIFLGGDKVVEIKIIATDAKLLPNYYAVLQGANLATEIFSAEMVTDNTLTLKIRDMGKSDADTKTTINGIFEKATLPDVTYPAGEFVKSFIGGSDYVVSGVVKNDSISLNFGGMSMGQMESNMAGSDPALNGMIELQKSNQGDVLVQFAPENAKLIAPTVEGIENVAITGAYFLFNNENDVDMGTNYLMMAFMKDNIGLTPVDDFIIMSMKSISDIANKSMNILTIMLGVISGISLVVGGIGIMNIMLVTVSERTREIGIRKAIGAKRSSILSQFLVEALVVTLFGGIIGIVLSGISALIIGHLMGIALVMSLKTILLSIGFSLVIGLVFGMYPAVKASRLQPIEALRRE
ncbi:MAG: FtsX-like permease family protein [Clostridia bacterium]